MRGLSRENTPSWLNNQERTKDRLNHSTLAKTQRKRRTAQQNLLTTPVPCASMEKVYLIGLQEKDTRIYILQSCQVANEGMITRIPNSGRTYWGLDDMMSRIERGIAGEEIFCLDRKSLSVEDYETLARHIERETRRIQEKKTASKV